MAAGVHNLLIEKGATFQLTLTMKDELGQPIDLTDQTFRGWVKKSFSDSGAVATFTFTLLDQTNPSTKGKVEVVMSATSTASIPVTVNGTNRTLTKMVYDIESRHNFTGVVIRWLQGDANISPEVTTI